MIQSTVLPQKYWVYKKSFDMIIQTRELFNKLFLQYKICTKCILRIYSIDQPGLYSDPQFFVQVLPLITKLTTQQLMQRNYKTSQCCLQEICWLCQQIFQKSYLSKLVKETIGEINKKGYEHWKQFKLNIRVPHVIALRNIILCRYLFYRTKMQEKDQSLIQKMYNILVYPLQAHKTIQPKTVLKWVLSNQIKKSTNMIPTADDDPQNLVISVQQDHNDHDSQSSIVNRFKTYLGLQKKKEKSKGRKVCLDMGEEKEEAVQEFRCNGYNINKITGLKQQDFQIIFQGIQNQDQFWRFINGNNQTRYVPLSNISHKLSLITKNVYLCGRYIKFSRYLSQTPWLVNGKKLTDGSLQQQIQDRIYPLFYPGKPKQQIQIKFHSGGRQDIDVRMLKGGRPFVLQFVNPIRSINLIKEQQVISLIPQHGRQKILTEYQIWLKEHAGNGKELHSWRIVKLLELLINFENLYVQVLNFEETTQSFISVELKAAETEKVKHYLCYIYSSQNLTLEDKHYLQSLKNIKLQQLTPLRVLHRRTLMNRTKVIHCLKMHQVSRHSAILQVWGSAGTYIKQFVHGDLGRTNPNIGSLIKKQVDILQLDVGSLKEGEWVEGDEQVMKLNKLQWMD